MDPANVNVGKPGSITPLALKFPNIISEEEYEMLNPEWRELTLEDTSHVTDKEPEKFWYTVPKENMKFLSRADGSACYSLGNTVVVSSVTGPTSTRISARQHNKCHLEVQFCPCNGQAMVGERAIENIISECVDDILASHLHPRATILVNIQELQSEHRHQLVTASINGTILALLDAGVQMKALLAAVSCCYTNAGVILVEPTALELQDSKCSLVFVLESVSNEVVSCHQEGCLSAAEYTAVLHRAAEAAKEVFQFYRLEMLKKYSGGGDKDDDQDVYDPL
ncbi:Exoribonuclease phosphorolytic domain 1 [Trinorchestia longiramus]|nr:Exoribonuclease phosphorolytic domain 1 [Trinorchestia longiramus]